jgi:hypothetical protein
MRKLILRMLILGAVGLTMVYAKTIGVFLKVFFKELMAGPKRAEA